MGWDSPDQHGPELESDPLLDADCRDWLEAHEAVVVFRAGNKVCLDVTRPSDGLRLQTSAWTLTGAVADARDRMRKP